jgi:drug/metabolite transporter (DMT)-like permease
MRVILQEVSMGFPYEGEIYSLSCAVVWALAVVLFRLSGQKVPPLALNFFKNTVAVVLFVLTLALLGDSFFPDVGAVNYILLALSGALGLAIADTLFFRALNVLGAGLLSIVGCLYSPSVIIYSVLILGERLSVGDIVGASLILSSVILSSGHKPPPGVTRRQLTWGVLIGAISFIFMGLGVAIAKPALNDSPVVWATAVRLFTATIMLAFITSLSTGGRTTWAAFRPSRNWKITVPASVIGAYLAMILWIAGIKYTYASVAAILNQTSVIFVLPFASLILSERITKTKVIAVAIALTGVVLVTLA